jgi:hypothetical protein
VAEIRGLDGTRMTSQQAEAEQRRRVEVAGPARRYVAREALRRHPAGEGSDVSAARAWLSQTCQILGLDPDPATQQRRPGQCRVCGNPLSTAMIRLGRGVCNARACKAAKGAAW